MAHNSLFKTSDGENTWTPISIDTECIINRYYISFSDSLNGMILSNTFFLQTSDGENNWTRTYSPLGREIFITSPSTDTIVSTAGQIYVTTDRGFS